ncbi:MAG: efflux RND transporter permease subunit [Gammaproteobacteria bacterium]|nr:efflux RND transporter permease subunit [Gammaproteobacteria bacterium]
MGVRNISAWAIRHPVFPLILFVVLTVCGIVAFIRLPINLNPDVSAPFIQVFISQPGAVPSELETQVMQKVDAAIANIADVKHISSRAIEGQALSQIEFEVGTPVDRALNDVRDAVARVRSDLPEGILEPIVQRMDIEGGAIAYYSATTSTLTEPQLSWFVDDTVTKRLLGIEGVAQVSRSGGVTREIRIDLDPARMQAFGITAAEVNRQLRQENLDAPGGRAQVGGGEQAIRVLGGAHNAAQLAERQIMLSDGRFARLRDIADVRDGVAEVRSISRLDGRPATTFGVFRSKGSSDVKVFNAIEAELARVGAENPDVKLNLVFTTVQYTRESYQSSMKALVEGAILAVAIVFLFLRDWRATAISALAIPLSALPTFAFMLWMGFTLNMISLLALSLVTGVLVDDAIVEIENISRHMAMGKSAYRAALDAADEIGLAVVATSMTIIAVFLPVSFMGGITGQFFREFGLTVAASVFFSLLVARLISPLIAAYTLRPMPNSVHARPDGRIMAGYLRALRWAVHHRGRTLAIALGFFALSITGLAMLPQQFIPESDNSSSQLAMELPPGVQLEQTAAASARAYAIIRRHPEIENVVESIGEDEDGEVRYASLYLQLVPREQRRLSQQQLEEQISAELRVIPDARIHFQSQSSGLGRDITLFVVGSDPVLAERTAHQFIEQLRGLKELHDPRINGDLPRPEIQIRPRTELAAQLGVTVASISETVRIATLGDIEQNSAKFSLSDRQIPIRVSLVEAARRDPATIENLPVRTLLGTTVPLKSVADISFGQGPSKIRHYDQLRRVAIDADLAGGVESGTALDRIHELPLFRNPPAGVKIINVGEAEYQEELFSNFMLAIAAGVMMVFAVLVLLFVRVFQPITILSALPLSLGGAAFALAVTGHAFSLPVVIGILMLLGIVAKNSILLVDFAIEEMRAGKDRETALLESGHKRARPIVMTTVAMVAGMTPVALGIGDDGFQAPMAIAVIGGLITSTALTLVMVPAVFCWVDDFERWLSGKIAHRVLASGAHEEHIGGKAPPAPQTG